MQSYQVKLEIFEGPLDLLLHLIKRNEVDIYDIPIARITHQYLEYLELMRTLDLDIAGEFLVMAATLIYIKSRTLLPSMAAEEESEEDLREQLVQRLLEYQRYKSAAHKLQDFEERRQELFNRNIPYTPDGEEQSNAPLGVSLFDLLLALQRVLNRTEPAESNYEVEAASGPTLEEKISMLWEVLAANSGCTFNSLFATQYSKADIVLSFLALLEMIRRRLIQIVQPKPFGEIYIKPV